jgi:pilus assembly protein CpaF
MPEPRSRAGASDFGPLARYVSDPDVTDVFVNGPDDLWVDRGAGLVRQSTWSCPSEAKLRDLAVAIVARGGRHIDEATPCADVRLHDGIRVHAALPPIAPGGTLLSIRIPPLDRPRLDSLAASGLFGEGAEAEEHWRTHMTVVAKIVAIDMANMIVTLKGPNGETYPVKAKDKAKVAKLAVGDDISIKATKALAIQVTTPSAAPAAAPAK